MNETININGISYVKPYVLHGNEIILPEAAIAIAETNIGVNGVSHVFISSSEEVSAENIKKLPSRCCLYTTTENLLVEASLKGFARYPYQNFNVFRIFPYHKSVMGPGHMFQVREHKKLTEQQGKVLAQKKSLENKNVCILFALPYVEDIKLKITHCETSWLGNKNPLKEVERELPFRDIQYFFRSPLEITPDIMENPDFTPIAAFKNGQEVQDIDADSIDYKIRINGMKCCNARNSLTHKRWIGWSCWHCGAWMHEDEKTLLKAGSHYHKCPHTYNHHLGMTCHTCGQVG